MDQAQNLKSRAFRLSNSLRTLNRFLSLDGTMRERERERMEIVQKSKESYLIQVNGRPISLSLVDYHLRLWKKRANQETIIFDTNSNIRSVIAEIMYYFF